MFFLPAIWILVAFIAGCATAQISRSLSSFDLRQAEPISANISASCLATCNVFQQVQDACNVPHCGCNVTFLQSQGNCLVCQTNTPQDAATVQFLLDGEMAQCHREGIPIQFQLDLPPDAAAIVQQFNNESADLRRNQTVFLALQIAGGHVGLVIVLIFAVFSRRVRRDPTFINFCITWIFSSIVFSLLLYQGTTDNTILNSLGEVPPNECLTQAALTEGAQVMTACSTLTLIARLWLGLRQAIYGDNTDPREGTKHSIWVTILLLVSPYLFFVAFALATVFVGKQHITIQGTSLQRVIPTNFYCTVVELNSFIEAVYGVTLALLIITMCFDAYIISVLYRHWRAFRHVQTKSAVSPSLLLRVIMFSIYRIVVGVAYGAVLREPPAVGSQGEGESLSITFSIPVWVDMLQAAIPLVGTLVLGISSDMITTLTFWRRNRPRSIQSLYSADMGNIDVWNVEDKMTFVKPIRTTQVV